MVLICISLVVNNFGHLFMCLLAMCVSLKKMSIQFLCLFFDWVVCFIWLLLLNYISSLYILDINHLSDM